jgi:HJR/Mrr/RecB family endonuclease
MQLVDGMRRYDCDHALLVTNSFLTEPALECAEAWRPQRRFG